LAAVNSASVTPSARIRESSSRTARIASPADAILVCRLTEKAPGYRFASNPLEIPYTRPRLSRIVVMSLDAKPPPPRM
jgi:hypothetical protein